LDDRFGRRLSAILQHATNVFDAKGYEGASMRDLSRVSGMSLAGLYHYFQSKERLLYFIQKHTFSEVVQRLRERLARVSDPKERVQTFIHNHLEYFLANQKAMKVLSHEDEVLTNSYGAEIRSIKREYYRICMDLVSDLKRAAGVKSAISDRTAVMALFGMINWIYTWYDPRSDATAEELSREMSELFINGVLCSSKGVAMPSVSRTIDKRNRSKDI